MAPFSICVIMKNEERHMESFLSAITQNLQGMDYEIVLTDTGSTDKTVSIAEKYTKNIYHFEWNGDFSAARNYCTSKALNDWILVLDCDEYIVGSSHDMIINDLKNMMNRHAKDLGMITVKNHYNMNGSSGIYTEAITRFFNRKYYHFEAIIHEQICPILNDSDTYDVNSEYISEHKHILLPLSVEHYGYNGTKEEMRIKAERNNQLLFKMLETAPDDPYLYFQLGQSFNAMGDNENACLYYGKGLEYDVDPRTEYVQMMVTGYGYSLINLGRFEEALLFENIYDEFSGSADFVCLMGLIYLRNGLVAQALEEFAKAATFKTARTEGCNSYIPTYNMGCIHEVLGNTDLAIDLYRKCGDFEPAKKRLAILI